MRFLAILFLYFISLAAAKKSDTEVSIDCIISDFNHFYFGRKSTCTLKNNPDITQPGVNVTGFLDCSKTFDNVEFFVAVSKIIRYIPRGLEIVFKNLIGLRFENTQLSYISKEDLKPYGKIKYFISYLNQIEFLEKDLFVNNLELEVVSFRSNKIKYIDPDVFEVIRNKLVNLWLDGTVTPCGLRAALNSNDTKKQLDNLKKSACVDIDNAPAFYIIQLRQQKCECEAEIEAAEAKCEERLEESVETCKEALQCCQDDASNDVCVQNFLDALSKN